ncbi:uncharacterized protein VDAG_00689 [Verticillium dahliae VdLs.17]|uniref:Rhodopsin domain-containing protein n=1 Tax=Verticillium dahliae (strain VdLs.17 / ATCC MYA-4575 / FGSC 10137) TaxID=498257 RepID=G2WQP7_VERDV|nr:uncharacterized protein VDAG_00689 [Verticillium dahliae VdLs.17]EGY14007.1 hypothetical protein VDAG_00689 [Verticillium dahliae VdLs.17]
MPLYSDPPTLRTFDQDKPTLLVCWWITIFCTVMIVLRVVGRFIRTEKLFREDKVVSLALIPMYLRMGCVHFILLYGTNNADFTGVTLSEKQHRQRQIASGLVLASRLLYAATLWILKDTILEYFRRLTETTSERYASQTLLFIRVALIATFIAIFISNFAECQPFAHYWQVLPDPGGQCRQGYAQLITMATCNIITDLLLVVFPIPMVLRSQLGLKKKVQLTLLFSLSLAVVVVTCYRVPNILRAHGNQQLRSLMASVELLFATTAANSLVLGSFVRDRGVKKKKFKYGSVAVDSLERTITSRSRRPTLHRHWGSDEDLVRDIGLGVEADLQNIPEYGDGVVRRGAYTPAPMARRFAEDLKHWNFPERQRSHAERKATRQRHLEESPFSMWEGSCRKRARIRRAPATDATASGATASYRAWILCLPTPRIACPRRHCRPLLLVNGRGSTRTSSGHGGSLWAFKRQTPSAQAQKRHRVAADTAIPPF